MKILVIEDEPEMRGLIKQFLQDENYVVEGWNGKNHQL
jgi:DNA-binding response OmpR family regulator